jgi:hypothetical protein
MWSYTAVDVKMIRNKGVVFNEEKCFDEKK